MIVLTWYYASGLDVPVISWEWGLSSPACPTWCYCHAKGVCAT